MDDLMWLGLSQQKAEETSKNQQLTSKLTEIANLARKQLNGSELKRQQATLLYHAASKIRIPAKDPTLRNACTDSRCEPLYLLVKHVCNDGVKNEAQLTAALDYVNSHSISGLNESDFVAACGAGVQITPDQIEDVVGQVVRELKPQLLKERYSFNIGRILGEVRCQLPWADGGLLKKEVDFRILELLGPKTAEELQPSAPTKGKGKKGSSGGDGGKENKGTTLVKKAADVATKGPSSPVVNGTLAGADEDDDGGAATMEELIRKKAHFHKPGENFKTDGYVLTADSQRLLAEHLKATGGKVVTRFPPEPNGILHIGHAKAVNINFGYAKAHNGICYLRFDDTNPEKEEERFFREIKGAIEWLGYKPSKITHSSDYFDQLYAWAVQLIKQGDAYVCHQTVEDMRGFEPKPSPWRERPVNESLQLFEDMRRGKFEEGQATLRLKTILEEGKMDPVAYRIKFLHHERTADKWCIYPTYDYTHCLCDSLENITHSLCTKEFQSRRSSYYWLCNVLKTYCPVQWEYGRLNMSYTVVSKRKILKLIQTKVVSDWDDPRLFTLTSLRRRGVPPEAVNNFVATLGLTVAKMSVEPHALDAAIRDVLNLSAPRTMAVLDPLKVTIVNWDQINAPTCVDVPDFPSNPETSTRHSVTFDRVMYIEKNDFKPVDERGFRRLTPNQSVGLKHVGFVLTVTDVVKRPDGSVDYLSCSLDTLTEQNKPKAFIHWVAKPIRCEVRLYDRLFNHKNPEDVAQVPNGFLSDCNPVCTFTLYMHLFCLYICFA